MINLNICKHKILEKTRIQKKLILRQILMISTFLNINLILKTSQNMYVIVVKNCVFEHQVCYASQSYIKHFPNLIKNIISKWSCINV